MPGITSDDSVLAWSESDGCAGGLLRKFKIQTHALNARLHCKSNKILGRLFLVMPAWPGAHFPSEGLCLDMP